MIEVDEDFICGGIDEIQDKGDSDQKNMVYNEENREEIYTAALV